MKYPSEYLTSKGVNKGDIVTFAPESEYEFTVDDEKLYRIYDHQISMVIWVKKIIGHSMQKTGMKKIYLSERSNE